MQLFNKHNQTMKKTLILLSVILLSLNTSFAQKQRNYIYVIDCTTSMINKLPKQMKSGDVDAWLSDTNLLYAKSKLFLKEDISRIKNEDATVVVIPFAEKPSSPICFKRGDFDNSKWAEIEKTMDNRLKTSVSTGICYAWDKGMEYIDQNKRNFFYLFTDGSENVIKDDPCQHIKNRIIQWRNHPDGSKAYIVSIDANKELLNKCPDLKNVIDNIDDIDFIDHHDSPFGDFTPKNELFINLCELQNKKLEFSDEGCFKATTACNDPYISVDLVDNKINSGSAEFHFMDKTDGELTNLIGADCYEFDFEVKSDPNELQIGNPVIHVIVDCHKRSNLNIADEEISAGKAKYYPKYLWKKAKEPEIKTIELNTDWNDVACANGAFIKLELTPAEGYTYYYNGEQLEGNSFIIKAGTQANKIGVKMDASQPDGMHYITLSGKPINLETLNNEPVKNYTNKIRIENDVVWNPLQWLMLILGIVLVGLLVLWFLAIRPIACPKIRTGGIQINSPYYRMIRFRNIRKVVFTNRAKRQNIFSRIFTGQVRYEVNDFWTKEWALTPGSRKSLRTEGLSKNYIIEPFASSLQPGNEYQITKNESGEKCTISIF